jgi:hypothetical protein
MKAKAHSHGDRGQYKTPLNGGWKQRHILTETADSKRHLSTEDESKGTFSRRPRTVQDTSQRWMKAKAHSHGDRGQYKTPLNGGWKQRHILTETADSTRHLSTEDENKGTFSLNSISASNSVTDYSPWRLPSRVETCRKFSRIKIICILVHWLVNIILCDTVHGHGTHYILTLYLKMRSNFFLNNLLIQLPPRYFVYFLYYLKMVKSAGTCCNEYAI